MPGHQEKKNELCDSDSLLHAVRFRNIKIYVYNVWFSRILFTTGNGTDQSINSEQFGYGYL